MELSIEAIFKQNNRLVATNNTLVATNNTLVASNNALVTTNTSLNSQIQSLQEQLYQSRLETERLKNTSSTHTSKKIIYLFIIFVKLTGLGLGVSSIL